MALVIAFLPDPVSAVREMARVVRPGGAVATYMWDMLAGGFTPTNPIYPAFRAMGIEPPLPPSAAAASSRDALQGRLAARRTSRDRNAGDRHSGHLCELR